MEKNLFYHTPVLLKEAIDGLDISKEGIYVDVTFGGGGHSREILNRLGEKGRLFGLDQDKDAEKNILFDRRFLFIRGNFRYLFYFMNRHGVQAIDGLLADLGVSSHHLNSENRGFSYRFGGNLDMRMDNRKKITAAYILNTYSGKRLANIFYLYGELKNAYSISNAIVRIRREKSIQTTDCFLQILHPFLERKKEKKQLAQIFQSLRIEVNKEIEALKDLLIQSKKILKSRGRIAIITYHSLEDRLIKSFFKTGNFNGEKKMDLYGNVFLPFRNLNNTVIVPSVEEIKRNPRSRSAKLRIAEKI